MFRPLSFSWELNGRPNSRIGILEFSHCWRGPFSSPGSPQSLDCQSGCRKAIYLSEYASPGTRNIVKPILEILAGIPTVVYGDFALIFVTPYVLRPIFHGLLGFEVKVFNAASAGIVVAIMIIPFVTSLSEDALTLGSASVA